MSFEKSAAEVAPNLPRYVRFRDLRIAGIVENWPQHYNLIDKQGFPRGIQLSANTRAWNIDIRKRMERNTVDD